MMVYCSNEFLTEYKRISRKYKKYPDFVLELKEYFLSKTFSEVATGDMLYGPPDAALWKKRLPDAGGYRFYFFAFTESECIYLAFMHPKRGPLGSPNIETNYKKQLHTLVLAQIKANECVRLQLHPTNGEIIFGELHDNGVVS